jgi:hypothetical protein
MVFIKEIIDIIWLSNVMSVFGFFVKDDEYDMLSLYWIPTLHKSPYKQHHIVAATKCSSKPLFTLFYSYRSPEVP